MAAWFSTRLHHEGVDDANRLVFSFFTPTSLPNDFKALKVLGFGSWMPAEAFVSDTTVNVVFGVVYVFLYRCSVLSSHVCIMLDSNMCSEDLLELKQQIFQPVSRRHKFHRVLKSLGIKQLTMMWAETSAKQP